MAAAPRPEDAAPASRSSAAGRWHGAALAAAAAYAFGAATTTPFTWAANAVTAVPIVGLFVLVVVCWPAHPQPVDLAAPQRAHHPYRPWWVLVAAVVVWELLEYLARGSRGAHPTLSSMADALDRHYLAETILFFAWLCLGAVIIRRGSTKAAGEEAPSR